MKRIVKILSLIAMTLLVSISTSLASELEFGPYAVGFETYRVYDDSRFYALGDDTISRPLLIHFWFPSNEMGIGTSLDFKHYIDLISLREDFEKLDSEIDNNTYSYVHAYSEFAKAHLGLDTCLNTQMLLDSPVEAKSGLSIHNKGANFPLLIYAPSNSKSSVQNHMICEYLASHGFMLVSVGSAGPHSIQRPDIKESTMAQVEDMEYILSFCEDSLKIQYTQLGVFGFSSGGNAFSIFQMKNKCVDAVLSMDGGQEYGAYIGLSKLADFNLDKTNIPYCSIVNNYENFSIYPMYNSVISSEKYLFRMPLLDHNGFISHWSYFDSRSSDSIRNTVSISYNYMCLCALGFLNKFLKPELKIEESFQSGLNDVYIQKVDQDFSSVSKLCNALLEEGQDSTPKLMKDYELELNDKENHIHLLGRMFIDGNIDLTIFLYNKNLEYHPDSWQAHFDLGLAYKVKGETSLAKKELLIAKKINPDNPEITKLLDEVN